MNAYELREALGRTFTERGRRRPAAFPAPPSDWAQPFTALAADVGIEPALEVAHRRAAAFLDPVLSGRTAGRWDPVGRRWVDDELPGASAS